MHERAVLARTGAKPVTPDQRIRDLRKEFRGFEREEPGPDRAARLAGFTRTAHDARQVNMAMQSAALCLEDDPDPPALLIAVYAEADETLEERLYALGDLYDLARYIDRPDIATTAADLQRACARAWVIAGDESERRYRLRTVQSAISREAADDIRDALRDHG
jgi:hypothetical protein